MLRKHAAFSLLEVLVAMAVLAIVTALSLSFISSSSSVWQNARSKVEMFREARTTFDALTRKLSQATLNTYWDYQLDGNSKPLRYVRASDLNFLSGKALVPEASGHAVFFQTPSSLAIDPSRQGMNGLLNAIGYYVTYDRKDANVPPFLANRPGFQSKWRYILHEVVQPTESLAVYQDAADDSWHEIARANGLVRPLAENIIALVIWPRLPVAEDPEGVSLAPDYEYDSRFGANASPQPATANQLPPTVQATIIAVDEASIARLAGGNGTSAPPSVIDNALRGRFTNAANYETDLDFVTGELAKNRINYRVFSAVVPLRESKWSESND